MPIQADFHLHSNFSGDCDTPMEETVLRAIKLGLTRLCFTEHQDFDFPYACANPPHVFSLNTDSYLYELLRLRAKYANQIEVLFGVELGLQPHLAPILSHYAGAYDFDFIIGSSHVCHGRDPYYPAFYEGRDEQEAYREYFTSILESIRAFDDFDVYGHLDYVVRYGPNRDQHYSYDKYQDILDQILLLLVESGKGIECNTGGLRSGLREQNPCTDILRRYRQLGGEIVTVGSDAHTSADLAFAWEKAADVLTACGFQYYCVFRGRTPEYCKF